MACSFVAPKICNRSCTSKTEMGMYLHKSGSESILTPEKDESIHKNNTKTRVTHGAASKWSYIIYIIPPKKKTKWFIQWGYSCSHAAKICKTCVNVWFVQNGLDLLFRRFFLAFGSISSTSSTRSTGRLRLHLPADISRSATHRMVWSCQSLSGSKRAAH